MATANDTPVVPVVPISWFDELHDVNCRLAAFQELLACYWIGLAERGVPAKLDIFAHGLDSLLEPVLHKLLDLESDILALRESYAQLAQEGRGHD